MNDRRKDIVTFCKPAVRFPAEGGIAFGGTDRSQDPGARLTAITIAHGYGITGRERKFHV